VLLDVIVLVVLALAALHGAMGGALRQVVQLLAAVAGWVAARQLSAPVAAGLGRWFPGFLARPGAAALLFVGTFALVSLVGMVALRGTSISTVVRGPTDRAGGAILGGVKGALVAWVLLSALALAGGALPGRLGAAAHGSEYVSLARDHNLIARIDPAKARLLERVLRAARDAGDKGPGAAEARALLANPRVRALADSGGQIDPAEAARLMDDPAIRELVEKIRERAGKGE
jgi:membrane protein required for colicin V production